MSHLSHQTPPRSLRLMAVALALVLISLLVNAGGPAANVEAGKDASVSITADNQNVKAGDTVKLKIKLQNVKNATLNGEALKDGKDKLEKKVTVCATTTYTVEAMPKDGGPKISQSLTINAAGTTANKDCPSPAAVPKTVPNPLPDLAVTALTVSQSWDPKSPAVEQVRVDYTYANLGQAPADNVSFGFYVNGQDRSTLGPTGTLKPGETHSYSYNTWKGDSGGSYTYSLVLDPFNKIVESDETNNAKAATIIVVLGANRLGGVLDSVQESDKVDSAQNSLKLIKP
jgi:hypothetical protein